MSGFREKCITTERTNERTDGQTQNHKTLPQGGGPINENIETEKDLP